MSDILTLEPLPASKGAAAPRSGFVAMFKAAMESLVRAQRQQYDDGEPLQYRFPPL
jgi:hypothetical protein